MRFKITGGSLKGRFFYVPQRQGLRPVTVKLREAFFNIFHVEGKEFMDVFAGSGVMGIEALSRGADFVLFIDKDIKLLKILRDNLKRLTIESEKWEIRRMDMNKPVNIYRKFDMVYADPPFSFAMKEKIWRWFKMVLKEHGILIVRRYKKDGDIPDEFHLIEEREYGDSKLYILRREYE